MTNPCRRFHGIRKIFLLKPQSNIDQTDEYRHFYQRTDNCGKSLAGIDAEDSHGHGNGQLKIIGGGCKRQGGSLLIGGLQFHGHEKTDQKHDQKIDAQRNGDP